MRWPLWANAGAVPRSLRDVHGGQPRYRIAIALSLAAVLILIGVPSLHFNLGWSEGTLSSRLLYSTGEVATACLTV